MKSAFSWFKQLTITKKVFLGAGALLVLAIANGSNQPTNVSISPTSAVKSQPSVTSRTETETKTIPFASTSRQDSTLTKGVTKVTTTGVNGSETLTYKITYTDGKQTHKQLIKTVVTAQPVTQVTSIGTYVAPSVAATPAPSTASNCDPNYSGACVPNVYPSDVDCAGGSGNGPYYVAGPVQVIGTDIYGLDRDGNGIGCE